MQPGFEHRTGRRLAARRNMRSASAFLLFEAKPNLSGTPDILSHLSPPEGRAVFDSGHRVVFDRGDSLFRQGEPHQGIFVLYQGIVRSFYVSPQGREITFACWTLGNFVGGPEIFGGGVHVWSGVAPNRERRSDCQARKCGG